MKGIYAQINKVDEEKRLVYGVAAAETPDRSGEILDYEGSKPHFQKWVDETLAATDGQSFGNLRAMHGKVAAGKLTGIEFDDAARLIPVVAKVVDDNEWKKVLEGVYTGFSIGGSYVKKWDDPEAKKADGSKLTRYIAAPNELSLVDRPCIPNATFFEIQKADGSLQKVEFLNKGEDGEEEDELDPDDSGDGPSIEKAGGPVEYQVDGSEADIALLAKTMHEHKLNVGQVVLLVTESLGETAARLAAKAADAGFLKKEADGELAKGMYMLSRLTNLIESFESVSRGIKYEEEAEKDYTSVLPEKADKILRQMADLLKAMVTEEVAEMLGERPIAELGPEVLAMADKVGGLEKIQARDKAANVEALEKFLNPGGPLQKAELQPLNKEELQADLQKLVASALEPLQKTITEQAEQIKKLEALPLQPKGVLKAVSKAADTIEGEEPPMVEPVMKDGAVADAATEIKKLHQSGGKPLAWGPGGPSV